MNVFADSIRQRLGWCEEQARKYAVAADASEGMIARSDGWRHHYVSDPYLIGAPDDRVAQRFQHVFMNAMELTERGQIAPLPIGEPGEFMVKYTHLLEEYEGRSGIPDQVIEAARNPMLAYLENGDPIAKRIFKGYATPKAPYTVKYGRREFLEPTFRSGRIRICPASYYNDTSHNAAVRDDELHRTFFVPTYKERLKGIRHIDFQGHRIDFGDDDIVIPILAPDYFLFSLCDKIYYRMPTDFGSDAAIIIRNPGLFAQRLISAFLARWSDWEPEYGPVTYYDPYRDYTKMRVHEMSKHFGYAYQREVRIVLRARNSRPSSLQPEFLDIGPMTDYADFVST
ncbi:hypothetical protein GUK34_17380 [Rhizobium leguminosarum]|uniref:hypothetical protein n=1 Tax=Rhizobium ruizarguesonis TaxID=2081791 RepID=UPI0013B8484C|nr:hypothetical protein [Rhizobium ruizarguesonis]NEI06588.1 hypothetical protein [Rhizobium ruizarguesonis]